MAWVAQGEDWPAKKAELQALGEQFESSQALFDKLKADAGGGKPITWAQMSKPVADCLHPAASAFRSGPEGSQKWKPHS